MDTQVKPRGCLGIILLLGGVLIGLFVIGHAVGVLVICLQCGTDAYFKQGVRRLPHRSALLTNGQSISGFLQLLWAVLSGFILWLWYHVWLHLSIAIEDRFSPPTRKGSTRRPAGRP